MSSTTVYIFHFSDDEHVTRIPYAKWKRIHSGGEQVEAFAGAAIRIAHAYLILENATPVYCPRIEGGIYYFDLTGMMIPDAYPHIDLLQELDEQCNGGIIDLQYHQRKRAALDKYCWCLSSRQIQAVIDQIW